ncbi:hypothetical protein CVT25_014199, partial [Psilocybe cyanescens]
DWSAQSRYKVLSELDDAFTWQKDDNDNHVTHVLAKDDNDNHVTHVLATSFEDSDLYLTPVLPSLSAFKSGHRSVSTSSCHDTQSSVSVPVALTSHNSSEDARLAELLKVEPGLMVHIKKPGLRIAYAKYMDYLRALALLESKIANSTWPKDLTAKHTPVVSLYFGKSTFHKGYKAAFEKIANYPEMVKWLEHNIDTKDNSDNDNSDDDDDKVDDVKVWGVKKAQYYLSDLQEWLENEGHLVVEEESQKKGKGKAKAVSKQSHKKTK